ncbi:S41 family peptidase [Sphingobacterium deserti]|uniref:S41 family peptidase n=1 Tax=Sphingobacterium deserti TaxID=1229276 RepID=UPI00056702BA|nr:S41 family peptidase [Sphingobacterium deserti]
MKQTFEDNDAGFEHILAKKGLMAYAAHNKSIEERVAVIDDYDICKEALEDWVKFFRNDHFRFTKTDKVQQKQIAAKIWQKQFLSEELDTALFKNYLREKVNSDIEGIWESPQHTIAVKRSSDRYVASILYDQQDWRKSQLVFEVNKYLDSGTRYLSTFKSMPIKSVDLLDNVILLVDQLTYRRVFPKTALQNSDSEFYRLKTSEETYGYKRDDKTVYLRIPSFTFNKTAIDSLITQMDKSIKETPNLIIDLRDCSGGQDNNFFKLMPYLFTGSSRTVYAEVRSTKQNNLVWESLIANPELDEEEKTAYRMIQNKLNENLGKYINIFGRDVSVSKKGDVLPFPKNIGIIVHENNFSTTEQFILAAKQSRKVKLFGRKTGGALDVSNMIEATSPTGDFIFEYCISRSFRIPDMAVDDMGIHPDIFLDKTIGENHWIDYVSDVLKEWE